jgi:hypothetical protein
MNRLDWREFEKRSRSFFEAELGMRLLEQMPLPLSTGENHKFDLTSSDEMIAIECKSHTWTITGNYPSAKVSDAQRSIELLRKSGAKQKIIVFQDDIGPSGSLVEVFVRRNRALLAGIQVWRLVNERFEKFVDYSSENRLCGDDGATNLLEIVFDASCKPYFEEQPKAVVTGRVLIDRRYRVGIRNASREIVPNARVLLESCDPSDSPGVHPGHTFQVMGEPTGTGDFSVHTGEVPSVFVDVVYDETLGGGLHGNAFGLCYAARVPSHAILRGLYVLTLCLDGGSTQSRKRFAVDQDPMTGMLRMRELKG